MSGGELDDLAGAARELAGVAGAAVDVQARAERLAERLDQGSFHVSVLGEFKRGKSTLVNALLGQDVLPTGVLPLTAVATEVAYGAEPGADVVHLDGEVRSIPLSELAAYVTEEQNPENVRQVARVHVRVPAALLQPGAVLVDTPGVGSIYRHNDEEARKALFDADGAILVLSADSPLSAQEHELLGVLAERRGPTFFVLNKVDHLAPNEVEQARGFVGTAMAHELGRKERLWCVSARPALDARRAGREPAAGEGAEFAAFAEAFGAFVHEDLVEARLATARREIARLGRELDDALSLEEAALALGTEELARRVEEFGKESAAQRQSFEDERTLLQRDVKVLMDELTERLNAFAREAPRRCAPELEDLSRTRPAGKLEEALREKVEEAVEVGFEEFRQAEAERVEQAWSLLAERFRGRTEERVNRVRAAAADLFTVSLPDVAIPEVAAEREQFFYLFLHVEPMGVELMRLARRFLPTALRRRRLLAGAKQHLAGEFDKHSGRARWDLSQRLDAVRRRFEVAMAEELDGAIGAIRSAAARADELRRAGEAERGRQLAESDAARQAARRALSFGGGAA